eukprot:NODE_259_length_11524_cov_0.251028.p5 type:complete len:141 gc:universal NODE_259_length_11524_cov_0.251028:8881-8459(-)
MTLTRRQILLTLLIIMNRNNLMLQQYKILLFNCYLRYNLRYIGPKIEWIPTKIPTQFYQQYGPGEFSNFFRMSIDTFNQLSQNLHQIYTQIWPLHNVGRPNHLFEWKLGIFLRYLARGECLNSLKHMYGCCKETARASTH